MTLRFRSSDLRHLFDALLAPPARANSGSCCSCFGTRGGFGRDLAVMLVVTLTRERRSTMYNSRVNALCVT